MPFSMKSCIVVFLGRILARWVNINPLYYDLGQLPQDQRRQPTAVPDNRSTAYHGRRCVFKWPYTAYAVPHLFS